MPERFNDGFIATLAGTYVASLQQAMDLIASTQPNLEPRESLREAERQADMVLKASLQIMSLADDIEPCDMLAMIKEVAATVPGGAILFAIRTPPPTLN